MVDLDWIAAKLIEQERANRVPPKHANWQEWKYPMIITTKFQYKSFNVDVQDTFTSVKQYDDWLTDMLDKGFSKPVFAKRDTPTTFPPQYGTVTAITESDKKWNGKPMFEVTVELDDGNEAKVNVFSKREWRVKDRCYYSVNEKGYPKLEAFGPDEKEDIPF